MQPEQFQKFTAKRLPSRENTETLRSIGIMLTEQGDDFGEFIENLAETLLDIRVAARGGRKNIKSRHWHDPEDGDK